MVKSNRYEILALHAQSMNDRLYMLAGSLGEETQRREDGSFFGSLIGTMNHLTFGDLFILNRARLALVRVSSLDALPEQAGFEPRRAFGANVSDLLPIRRSIDTSVVAFSVSLTDEDLGRQEALPVPLWVILDQYFQHQTHHRGQATALLSQNGLSYPSFADVIGTYQGR